MTPDRSARPVADTPRPLRLPRFDRTRLENGLQVEFAPRPGVPEVSIRLVIEAGATTESTDKRGTSELVARLLTEGSEERSAIDMARWLDRLGASFDASAGFETCSISMHVLPDVLDEALEFLAHAIIRPTFPENDFDRLRDERLDEIERQRDDPATVADHALIHELYGNGLYGRPIGGTRETVSAIGRDDVIEFHGDRYGADGALLIACGDVDHDRLIAAARQHLGGWSGAVDREPPPEPPEVGGGDVVLIDRPDSPQAELRIATIGVSYGTEDHHAITVANAILGGLFNSRINMNLREDKGWTYGARSAFRFRRGAGPFVARTAVETGVTAEAFREMLTEIETMREELVSPEELELARHALTLSLPLQFEGAVQITRKVSRQRIYDLPDDYWEAYRERIEAVTADEIRDVCRRYLSSERLTLLTVTDAEAVRAGLEPLGNLEVRPAS
ncbi:MAG: insulinase family protein [Gemmatimonadetes bacterium]|nr:insulinase family protein [Gemmatimonadota bacterium]